MTKTFAKGGVHPPENKLAAQEAIKILPLPEEVIIPVSQHIGAPAKVLVKKKDQVKVGQLIAESGGFISANIHSSVSGTVTKIDSLADASGYKRPAIVIKVEGDEWLAEIDRSPELKKEITASPEEIVKAVAAAGIVGLGGATFPSHVKLSVPKGMTAEVLILNGVECEPYLTDDHRLMLEHGEELLVGISLQMKALKINKAVIGIENNKPDAIAHLSKLCLNYEGISVCPLKVKYPQGAEKQLVKAVTGREIPSGALPLAVGAVVHNVGTCFAVYEAVQKHKPLIERVVTITGKPLQQQANFKVRLGTPVDKLIEAVGGLPEDTGKVIMGGPMMGKAIANTTIPVTKGTSAILLLSAAEAKRHEMLNCIRCGKCVSVCPMGLEPYLLMTLVEHERFEDAEKECIMDCIACGSCSYTCPSNRILLDYIHHGKGKVVAMIRARKK